MNIELTDEQKAIILEEWNKNPNSPPTIAVTISTASIFNPIYKANELNNVAHIIAKNICGRNFPIILSSPNTTYCNIVVDALAVLHVQSLPNV